MKIWCLRDQPAALSRNQSGVVMGPERLGIEPKKSFHLSSSGEGADHKIGRRCDRKLHTSVSLLEARISALCCFVSPPPLTLPHRSWCWVLKAGRPVLGRMPSALGRQGRKEVLFGEGTLDALRP